MDSDLPQDLLARGCVRVDVAGRVMSVYLDRPESRNAQTPATWAALAAVGRACADGRIDAVVIRGSGSAFSAGMDRRMFTPEGIPGETSLGELTALGDRDLAARIEVFQQGFAWQRTVPAVTIAAVHGPAVGAGFQLALACDILLATPDASFAMRETSYGLVPDLGGTHPLVRAVGYSRAVDICATGRTISAQEGFELGFVTRVVDDLEGAVASVVTDVESSPRGAVSDLKALLAGAEERARDVNMLAEREAQVRRLRALTRDG